MFFLLPSVTGFYGTVDAAISRSGDGYALHTDFDRLLRSSPRLQIGDGEVYVPLQKVK